MGIHITSLVVQERQAGEDFHMICFLRSIATEDVSVIRLSLGDLMPCRGLRSGLWLVCGRLQ